MKFLFTMVILPFYGSKGQLLKHRSKGEDTLLLFLEYNYVYLQTMETHQILLEYFKTRRSKNIELEVIIKKLGVIGKLNLLNGFIPKRMWQMQ